MSGTTEQAWNQNGSARYWKEGAGESDLRSSSNGVGVKNVMERLELYFHGKAKFEILSEGKDTGTEILITIPKQMEGEE